MAAVHEKIRVQDYNIIQSLIAEVLGTGSANFGYGQVVQSSQVSLSSRVTVNEYAALRYDIINAYKHLNNTAPSGVDAQVIGSLVRYNLADAPVEYWETVCNNIRFNRLNTPPAGQRRSVVHGPQSESWPNATYGASWGGSTPNDVLQCTVNVFWPTSADARHFFNSGSAVQFSSSRVGGTSNNQNASWSSILTTAGTRTFQGNSPGTGTEPNDGTNYFRLSSSYQVWSTVTGSSPYTLNQWRISARTPTVSDNSAGTAREIDFLVEWVDNHVPLGGDTETGSPVVPGPFGPDFVDGTITLNVDTLEATGVLEPITAGNFTIITPTITIGSIIPT